MSRSLRWSCCATAFSFVAALGGINATALGQYTDYAAATPEAAWTPADYSDAYAPHAVRYAGYNGDSCDSCDSGCASGSCGADCGSAYGDGYGSKGCCGDVGCGSYGGGCAYGDDGGYGACGGGCDNGCDPYATGCDTGCGPYYDDGVKCGFDPCAAQRCHVPCCSFFADYLFWQVSDADVAHAQQQDGIGGAGTVPFGDIGTVGFDWENGYRVGGSIACGPCSDVVTTLTTFEVDSIDSISPPTIPGGGGAVGSLVHHPGAAITASTGPLDARYEIDLQLGDIMCRTVWREGCNHMVRWMVGGQYGHLDQDFAQTGVFGGGQTGTIDTSTSIDFDGGGLKAGLDAERRLGHGILVYGRLTAAAMTGRFNSRYTMLNSTTDTLLAQANWKDDRVVSQLEYEFGVGITSIDCHWRATAGYMLSYWDNVVTTSDFIDAVQADNYSNVGDSIIFDGFVSRVEYRW